MTVTATLESVDPSRAMSDDNELKDAVRVGLQRAAIHWLRAGYEVVAGVGALLNEVADSRKGEPSGDDDPDPDGPIRIELD